MAKSRRLGFKISNYLLRILRVVCIIQFIRPKMKEDANMPRPKGSKNKKSSLTVAQIEADIEKQDAVIAQLRSRAADVEQKLTDKKNEQGKEN